MIPPFDTRRRLRPHIAASRFVNAACEPDAAAAEFSADLFEAYRLWCWATNTRPMSQTALGRELAKLGHAVKRHRSGRKKRAGLRLKACFRPQMQVSNSTEGEGNAARIGS
jgi:phage/plasmid-associated DNA primase